jgi:hypothetical protein
VDDVAQVALDVVVCLAAATGEDLQRRARRGQCRLGVDELGVHQLGVAVMSLVEHVDAVVGRQPRGHEARAHVPEPLRDGRQLGERFAVQLSLPAEGDGVVEDRLVDAKSDRGQVGATVERARGVGHVEALALVADPVLDGDAAVFEDQLAIAETVQPGRLPVASEPEPGAVALHEERREPAGASPGPGHHAVHVADVGVATKHLRPLRTYESPSRRAVVRIAAGSEPAWASERQ